MEAELVELLAHTLTYEAPDGTFNGDGTPNYAAGVSLTCRIRPMKGEEIIRDSGGQERVATWKITVNDTSKVMDAEGRLTLPSGYDPQQPPFFSVAHIDDESTYHHTTVMV